MGQPLISLSINLKNLLIYARGNVEGSQILFLLIAIGKILDSYIHDKKFDFSSLQVEIDERIPEKASMTNLLTIGEVRLTDDQKELLLFMGTIIERAKSELQREQFKTAYVLIDTIHFLPEALVSENWNSKAYWRTFIENQELFDKEFKEIWRKKFKLLRTGGK